MPISRERAHLYPKNWSDIAAAIRERKGNLCKWCGAPNGMTIWRDPRNAEAWHHESVEPESQGVWEAIKYILVVLTVAHLDHDPTNNDEKNLAALCQRCHNRYDKPHRMMNARRTRRSKKAVADMFESNDGA